jgi:toxin ParE1/3/4
VRIVWLRAAERNLEEQLEYIGERNQYAAGTLADKIAASVARLEDHPRRRPAGRVTGTRELVVPSTLT